MKSVALGLALAAATAWSAAAMEPAKTMMIGGAKVFTDAKGMTLYVFDKDEAGKSNCYDTCAKNWPPFKAKANAKAEGSWSIVTRTDGSKMWAYDGKPLYTFIKDKKAGDVAGDGMGGVWHIAKDE